MRRVSWFKLAAAAYLVAPFFMADPKYGIGGCMVIGFACGTISTILLRLEELNQDEE